MEKKEVVAEVVIDTANENATANGVSEKLLEIAASLITLSNKLIKSDQ